ncbi:MAG: hypothetical protein ABI968_01620 [Acidobacteriota bacterium]
MSDERKDVENPLNELKPTEKVGQSGDAAKDPTRKPAKAFPPGSSGELNDKDEDSPSGDAETLPDGAKEN